MTGAMAMAPQSISGTTVNPEIPQSQPHIPKLRQPLPLSAAQEAQVRDLYHKRVRSRCAPEIRDFAQCAKGRTFSTSWHCRSQRLAMNSCMIAHATQAEEDAAREEWFSGIEDRRRKREEEGEKVEGRRREIIEMTRRQEEKEKLIEEERKRNASNASAEVSEKSQGPAKRGWFR